MFTVRLPTFYELLAAEENLKEVAEARRIPISADQRELCTMNDQYGLTALHSEEPTFEVITDTSKEFASSALRLAISAQSLTKR
jgi:hypothetical protein